MDRDTMRLDGRGAHTVGGLGDAAAAGAAGLENLNIDLMSICAVLGGGGGIPRKLADCRS
jgi:hypothetical protein